MNPDLGQLRDIHLPPPVSWWPPAPGWWLLAAILILLVALAVWLFHRHRRDRWRRAALKEWRRLREDWRAGAIDGAGAARQLSVLLRRVALVRFPRRQVAALTGEAWLAFLDSALPGQKPFSTGPGRALLEAPYAVRVDIDTEALFEVCGRWLRSLPRRKAR